MLPVTVNSLLKNRPNLLIKTFAGVTVMIIPLFVLLQTELFGNRLTVRVTFLKLPLLREKRVTRDLLLILAWVVPLPTVLMKPILTIPGQFSALLKLPVQILSVPTLLLLTPSSFHVRLTGLPRRLMLSWGRGRILVLVKVPFVMRWN